MYFEIYLIPFTVALCGIVPLLLKNLSQRVAVAVLTLASLAYIIWLTAALVWNHRSVTGPATITVIGAG